MEEICGRQLSFAVARVSKTRSIADRLGDNSVVHVYMFADVGGSFGISFCCLRKFRLKGHPPEKLYCVPCAP